MIVDESRSQLFALLFPVLLAQVAQVLKCTAGFEDLVTPQLRLLVAIDYCFLLLAKHRALFDFFLELLRTNCDLFGCTFTFV